MRIDRVKLIAEMARQDVGVADLSQRATVSRATITALRGGKSCNANSVRRVASALGVTVESLLEDGKEHAPCLFTPSIHSPARL